MDMKKIILCSLLVLGSSLLMAQEDIAVMEREKIGSISPQEIGIRAGGESYYGIDCLNLGPKNEVDITTDDDLYRTTLNRKITLLRKRNTFVDITSFTSGNSLYTLSYNSVNDRLQIRKFENDKSILLLEEKKYDEFKISWEGMGGFFACTILANGNVIIRFSGPDQELRALYSVKENTMTPLFSIDRTKDRLNFIDEYGYHYFNDKVVDINGKYVAPLIWPEGSTGIWGAMQGGKSDTFLYKFTKTKDNKYDMENNEKDIYAFEYETKIKIYTVFRCNDYWEIMYYGIVPLNHTILSRKVESNLLLAPPLKNFTETGLEECIYTNTAMDEEGRIYYMELDADELRIMRVTLDVNVKFIRWAQDGITQVQVANPPDEIIWYLEQTTPEELRRFRNAFFALKGYQFKSEDLNTYFSRYSWYKHNPTVQADIQTLSESQQRLLKLVQSYEAKK